MINNKKHIGKRTPLANKIGRLFTPAKGTYAHKRYPEEYFWNCWFNRSHTIGIKLVAEVERKTKKATAQYLNELGLKYWMALKWEEDMDDPGTQDRIAKRARFNLALRRICRELGWNINKLL